MNILTFDIEEWYLEKKYWGNHKEKYKEFDGYLDRILCKLDERRVKGTFFCVGGMALEFPGVVNKIATAGHEIGCHSFNHLWLNKLSKSELAEDTRISIDALEQCIGNPVLSYRAPAFSIGKDNKFALEILAKNGIKRDASIFPAERDFGGFAQFEEKKPTVLFCGNTKIKEFPVCTTKLFGKEIAYSGGGYFRFFPLSYVKTEMGRSDYVMTYFHIGDLVPETGKILSKVEYECYFKETGSLKNRYLRYIKTNLGKKKALDKLLNLIDTEDFVNLELADQMINWEQAPSVII